MDFLSGGFSGANKFGISAYFCLVFLQRRNRAFSGAYMFWAARGRHTPYAGRGQLI